MGMFSEVATEGIIREICEFVDKEITRRQAEPEVVKGLKSVGRHALTLFEWSEPEWAKEYKIKFIERRLKKLCGN